MRIRNQASNAQALQGPGVCIVSQQGARATHAGRYVARGMATCLLSGTNTGSAGQGLWQWWTYCP
jgi:hypothetical protein